MPDSNRYNLCFILKSPGQITNLSETKQKTSPKEKYVFSSLNVFIHRCVHDSFNTSLLLMLSFPSKMLVSWGWRGVLAVKSIGLIQHANGG